MIVYAGPHEHEATDGTVIHVDQPLSREQVDLIVRVIQHAGQTPDTTSMVDFDGESPPRLRLRRRPTNNTKETSWPNRQ